MEKKTIIVIVGIICILAFISWLTTIILKYVSSKPSISSLLPAGDDKLIASTVINQQFANINDNNDIFKYKLADSSEIYQELENRLYKTPSIKSYFSFSNEKKSLIRPKILDSSASSIVCTGLLDPNTNSLGNIDGSIYNRLVLVKAQVDGIIYYLCRDNNKILLKPANSISGKSKQELCCWKLILGLSGDSNSVSFYHIDSSSYIIRTADNNIILAPAEYVEVDETKRQAATFRLIDGMTDCRLVPSTLNSKPTSLFLLLAQASKQKENKKGREFNGMPMPREFDFGANNPVQTVSFMPIAIGNENTNRLLVVNGVVPHVIKYSRDDHDSIVRNYITSFDIVDNIMEHSVVFGLNSAKSADCSLQQPFQDYNSSRRHCNKSSSKRDIAGCVLEGNIRNDELSAAELFQDVGSKTGFQDVGSKTGFQDVGSKTGFQDVGSKTGFQDVISPYRAEFDPATANMFSEHTGAEFNQILNQLKSKTINTPASNQGIIQGAKLEESSRDAILDNIFYKLENAKLDPNVENLLEYNAARNKIYVSENNDFEDKITERIKKNTALTDELIYDMNNYRVQNMARDYFFLKQSSANNTNKDN